MWRPLRWLAGKRGDMVWNTLVIVTVMIPLLGFTLDLPRYFMLRNTLQNATDAAAEAAAQTLDADAFVNGGEVRLSSQATRSASDAFGVAAAPMTVKGYSLALDGISIDEGANDVQAVAHGDIRYMFGLTPSVTLHAQGRSRYRTLQTK